MLGINEVTRLNRGLRVEEKKLYVADIDSVIDGSLLRLIQRGEVAGRIIIHKAIVEFLYSEARRGLSHGFTGLSELSRLLAQATDTVEVMVVDDETRYPRELTIDSVKKIVRDYAWKSGAVLVTSDRIQVSAAKAMGTPVLFAADTGRRRLRIEDYFTDKTMSVHLKEGAPPLAKIGRPGKWAFVAISSEPMTRKDIEEIAREVVEAASRMEDGFVEIDRPGSTIVQLHDYRIVITRPPLSEGWEITAVRPIAKLSLDDYNIPEKLLNRLIERAEGILIAGAPGMGKTTFAQALAEFYASKGKIVKTIESPRDMRLPPTVTQYSKNYADLGELHDILLLSRPDYTFYDELRSDEDFQLYVDLRLAGIGMVGVVHATTPIDAVQRFIRRVELGMIPSIIDTVIFINEGQVEKVYELSMTVKLPTGLREAELSRPVVEVKDFLTGELEYEIYTFGEQTMVVPVKEKGKKQAESLEKHILKMLPDAAVEIRDRVILVRVPRYSPKLTARRIKRLRKLAEKAGYELRIIPF
ncbi:MAG: PINc/VapC family ATPase [Desulfurococcales archaeon]|nr:PINc/VapC family ATPase [Desulfurococcales archaeon]